MMLVALIHYHKKKKLVKQQQASSYRVLVCRKYNLYYLHENEINLVKCFTTAEQINDIIIIKVNYERVNMHYI